LSVGCLAFEQRDAIGDDGEVAVAACPRNGLAEQVEAWIGSLQRVASGAEPLPA